MKKITYLLSFLVLISFVATGLKAQDQDAMKKWMDAMTPGDIQKGMAKMTGDWKYTSKFWMAPGQEPMVSSGTARYDMLLGDRYLHLKVSGNMMGMPFEGIGITGYNNVSKTYESSWIDNFGTGVMYMTGKSDDKGVITMTGSMVDPLTGKSQMEKQVLKQDGDKFIMEMYSTKDGVEIKTMEITYTK